MDRKGRLMQSLGRALPLRRDPAPSRWAYRMQRLWLTPLFRVTMRVGMPAFFVALALCHIDQREGDRAAYVHGQPSVD
jgi:cell division protein FtsQ